MGWVAFIETDFGETLRVIRPDGRIGGNALLSFFTIAASGCDKNNFLIDELKPWVTKFNENSKYEFCSTVDLMNKAIYSGNWDYQDNEYDFFLYRSPGLEISEVDFKKTIKIINKKWTDIQELIRDITILVDEFKKGYLKETDWYVEQDTIGDFEGLLNTLILAKKRNAEKIRIRIE